MQHEYAPKVRAWQPDWSTNRQYQTYTHHFALLSNWREGQLPAYCSRWGHHKDARVVNGDGWRPIKPTPHIRPESTVSTSAHVIAYTLP